MTTSLKTPRTGTTTATITAADVERSLFERLRGWAFQVDSEDPSVQRRARTFIPLTLIMLSSAALCSVVLAFVRPGPFVQAQLVMAGASVASNLAAIALARRGRMNFAGVISGGTSMIAFLVVTAYQPTLLLALGWFYGVGVLLASYAMRPRYLFWMWLLAQTCLAASFALVGPPQFGQRDLWAPTMSTLLLFVTLASYLHARATEEIFSRQLESSRQLLVARNEAEQASRAKSIFLANMSHELRTPLNAILGYSEMLAEEHHEDRTTVDDLERIHASGAHLLALINDVLDLSKIEAGKMELLLEAIEIDELLEQLTFTVGALISKRRNRLVTQFEPDCGAIATDRTKLRQVMLNLIANAAKFTEAGLITLSARRVQQSDRGPMLEFSVSDTGIGMTSGQLERVFEEFEQADTSTTKQYGGTGLGLSLCRRLAHLLEGEIEAVSEPGQGSTFTLRVALVHTQTPPQVAAHRLALDVPIEHAGLSSCSDISHALQSATLLVIDDDDSNDHALLRRAMEREGFELIRARSGEKGLEVIAQGHQIDVILLDGLTLKENSWSVLERLKSDPLAGAIPVLMLADPSVATPSDATRALTDRHDTHVLSREEADHERLVAHARRAMSAQARYAPTL